MWLKTSKKGELCLCSFSEWKSKNNVFTLVPVKIWLLLEISLNKELKFQKMHCHNRVYKAIIIHELFKSNNEKSSIKIKIRLPCPFSAILMRHIKYTFQKTHYRREHTLRKEMCLVFLEEIIWISIRKDVSIVNSLLLILNYHKMIYWLFKTIKH